MSQTQSPTMSSIKSDLADKPKVSKVKPEKKTKVAAAASADGPTKTIRKRRPPFDVYNPHNYTKLSSLWRHRSSLRKGRARVEKKLNDIDDPEERMKLETNLRRYDQNLEILNENHEEVQTQLKYAMDLTGVAEKTTDPSQKKIFQEWASSFTAGLTADETKHNDDDDQD